MNKTTVHRWMRSETLPMPDKLKEFRENYNTAVKGLDGYSPIGDDERDRALALLHRARQEQRRARTAEARRRQRQAAMHAAARTLTERDTALAE